MNIRFFYQNRIIVFLMMVLVLLAGMSTRVFADGSMYIDRAIVTFEPGKASKQDVMVINTSDEPLYIQTEVLEVKKPGTSEEKREAVKDPKSVGLLATPNRFIIPPNGRKPLRIVNLKPPGNIDRIFRINITPTLPPLTDPKNSLVRVVIAYQVLVIIQPNKPEPKLIVSPQSNTLLFENQGNSNVLLLNGEQCDLSGEVCEKLTSRRIYAGNQWQLDLPLNGAVTYDIKSYNGVQRKTLYEPPMILKSTP